MGDDALTSQRVVVRALKEILFRMRVLHQLCALAREHRSEVRALVAGQPKLLRFYLRIGPAEHFELQIGNQFFFWERQIVHKIIRAVSARFFAAEGDEINRPFWRLSGCKKACELENSDCTRCIVIGSVEQLVIAGGIWPNAEVVKM